MNEDILLEGIWHLRSSGGSMVSGRVQESNLAILVSCVSHLLEQWGLLQIKVSSVLVLSSPRPGAGGRGT